MKSKAREFSITFDKKQKDTQIYYEIEEKMSESSNNNQKVKEIIKTLHKNRESVISDAQSNSTELLKWLYEKQGILRFGAENRIFIILVDIKNMNSSWKMKRNFKLLEPKINKYLDYFNNRNSLKDIEFKFNDKNHKTKADIIFITK